MTARQQITEVFNNKIANKDYQKAPIYHIAKELGFATEEMLADGVGNAGALLVSRLDKNPPANDSRPAIHAWLKEYCEQNAPTDEKVAAVKGYYQALQTTKETYPPDSEEALKLTQKIAQSLYDKLLAEGLAEGRTMERAELVASTVRDGALQRLEAAKTDGFFANSYALNILEYQNPEIDYEALRFQGREVLAYHIANELLQHFPSHVQEVSKKDGWQQTL